MTVGWPRAAVAAAALSGVPSAVAWPFGGADPLPATREIGRFTLGRPSLLAGAVARCRWPEIRRHGGLVQIAGHVTFGAVPAVASAPGKPSR